VGESFLPLRLVSLLASAALLGLLYRYAWRATGRPLAGLVAAGLFAAAQRFAGSWLDVGRVDALGLALVLACLHVARFRPGRRGAATAGVLGGLALLAKQTGLPVLLLLLIPLARRCRGEALIFGATLLFVAGGTCAGLHFASQGWSSWYLFELLGGHPWYAPGISGFWVEDLIWLAPALFVGITAPRAGPERADRTFLWIPALGLIVAAWLGRSHPGGYDNTLLPAVLAAALFGGIGVGRVVERYGANTRAVLLLVTVQFVLFAIGHPPVGQLPSAADRRAGEAIVQRLAEIDGPVFAPHQDYLARRAGKGASMHAQAWVDVLTSEGQEEHAARLVAELEERLARRAYGAVLLAQPWDDLGALRSHYRLAERLLPVDEPQLLRPVTGAPKRPELLYLPRD